MANRAVFANTAVDRIVPGAEGGRYVRGNIRPMCGPCNSRTGGELGNARRADASDEDRIELPGDAPGNAFDDLLEAAQ